MSFILILIFFRYFARKGHISPPKGLKLGMELILDTRNSMVGSKLTLKVIFKAKKAKIELRENIRILAVLTKLKRLDVLTKLKLNSKCHECQK